MFTGIVEGTGRVAEINEQEGGKLLKVDISSLSKGVTGGDSISIDGVCLTVVSLSDGQVSFDIVAETLTKTTLGGLKANNVVNIERSVRAGDRIDGHFVQGHVQGLGEIIERADDVGEFVLWIKPPAESLKFIAPQGSIAVNGVSLTVARLKGDAFSVALIPTTLKLTNLGQLTVGDRVNIETDAMARQMVRWLELRHE